VFVEIQNGRIVGYITSKELAEKLGVTMSAIRIWVHRNKLEALKVGDELWFKADTEYPERRKRASH
jgi:excisionase family DNA binding protein